MKIGQVAQEAGVSVDTIRFYERRGVLPTADRKPSGYRSFDPTTVDRIRLAKSLQELGFTLDEVVETLHAHDAGGATCDSERWRLEAVLDRIEAKIIELRQVHQTTANVLQDCQSGRCRLIPANSIQ